MARSFSLKIHTPDKSFLEAEVEEVIFSTPRGRMGVMAMHMPLVAAVTEGELEILAEGKWKDAVLSQGYAEIGNNSVEFFVDTAEWADDIDEARAREALARAELRLKAGLSTVEYIRTQAAIARALARIKASEDRRGR